MRDDGPDDDIIDHDDHYGYGYVEVTSPDQWAQEYYHTRQYELTGAASTRSFGLYVDAGPRGPIGDIWYDDPRNEYPNSDRTSDNHQSDDDNDDDDRAGNSSGGTRTGGNTQTGGNQGATQSGSAGDGTRGSNTSSSSSWDDVWDEENDTMGGGAAIPIILDLDGFGISVTELSQSPVFVDGGDGLEHRTAWAGVGDGVLFFDADGSGTISERREYVFGDWDPTATSDLEALRPVFDTNGDGRLTNADSTWPQFRVARTEPDGTLSYHTLDALGITEIDLMGDATNIELPDGSVITGQTTFTMNGQTRTVGEMVLATDGRGYRLEETESLEVNGTSEHCFEGSSLRCIGDLRSVMKEALISASWRLQLEGASEKGYSLTTEISSK